MALHKELTCNSHQRILYYLKRKFIFRCILLDTVLRGIFVYSGIFSQFLQVSQQWNFIRTTIKNFNQEWKLSAKLHETMVLLQTFWMQYYKNYIQLIFYCCFLCGALKVSYLQFNAICPEMVRHTLKTLQHLLQDF